MNRLTDEQRALVLQHEPMARGLARRYGVDTGVAYLALCKGAQKYDPSRSSQVRLHLYMYVASYCRNAVRDEARRRRLIPTDTSIDPDKVCVSKNLPSHASAG